MECLPMPNDIAEVALAVDSLYLVDDVLKALQEIHRILRRQGVLAASLYSRRGPRSPSLCEDWWRSAFSRRGFEPFEWYDATSEWRALMMAKHVARLQASRALVAQFGPLVNPFLAVSVQLVGTQADNGFLNTTSRWEILARRSD
jgi:SAM-dependent methyltransferase